MKTQTQLFGSLLIALGILFMLSSMGVIHPQVTQIIFSWQALLILLAGIAPILYGHLFGGAVGLIVGGYFLLPKIYGELGMPMPIDPHLLKGIFVASLLTLAGVGVISGGLKLIKYKQGFLVNHKRNYFETYKQTDGASEISCIFGQTNHHVIERPFRGAKVSTIFGGTTIDLSKTELSPGETHLEFAIIFSGSVVMIPEDWVVISRVSAIFGGVKDMRTSKPIESDRKLIITGGVIFGGVEIRSLEAIAETVGEQIDTISVRHNNRVHIISLDELLFIQSDGDYVTLVTSQGKFLKEQTMKYFHSSLPADKFVRIHRSYIVNLSQIASIDSRGKETYYVVLKDGTSLRASVSGYQELKQRLGDVV